jgi:hypothetical protein
MPDLPQHPDSTEPAGPQRRPIGAIVGVIIAVALIAAFIVLHLTGVLGPGGH